MPDFRTAQLLAPLKGSGHDRVGVFGDPPEVVIAVVDGASGMPGAALAADTVLKGIRKASEDVTGARYWAEALSQIDREVEAHPMAGEAAAVVAAVTPDGVFGASVGDNRALLVYERTIVELTSKQARKPLLGSGLAVIVPFIYKAAGGTLLAATDGLFSYAKPDAVVSAMLDEDLEGIPKKLVDLARLPSGGLWDDVGLVLCRRSG